MEVRITFRSEVYLEGKDLEEIKSKFEQMDLNNDSGMEFVELVSVEDANTYEDLTHEYKNA